jgi:hypothetical protein
MVISPDVNNSLPSEKYIINTEVILKQLQVLVQKPQWVVWCPVERNGKTTKPPFDPKTGNPARVNDPSTWADFQTALNAYERGGWAGLGIVLTEDLGLAGFDFDHCLDTTGRVIDPKIQTAVEILSTYTEVSPSGIGLRAFCFGKIPGKTRRAGRNEVYSGGRYLTVTGNRWFNSRAIESRQAEIDRVYPMLFKNTGERIMESGGADRRGVGDVQGILDKAFTSDKGAEIRALMSGNWEGFPSQSEADLRLCTHLAFWLNRDPALMDQVFRSSGLIREKWERKIGKAVYGQATIQKAISAIHQSHAEFKDRKAAELSTGTESKPPEPAEPSPGSDDDDSSSLKAKAQAVIDKLNKTHAVVMIGGKLAILNEGHDPVTGRPDITFSSVMDFKHRYATESIKKPSNKNEVGIAHYWFTSKKRRQYSGIVFNPAGSVNGFYNLWRGFAIDPKPGKWDLMRRHIWENICCENDDHFKWLLAWFARIIQNPGGDRPGTSVVLKGKKGTGKGVFINQFGYIFGSHFLPVSSQRHVTGRFNSHLKDVLLLYVDEGFWAGSKGEEGVLKHLITDDEHFVEPKGKDGFTVKNHINIVMSSNERWVVPASFEERRFFVLELSDKHMQDKPYFKAIYEEMNNGGREAMLYDLLNLDISGIDLRTTPRTKGLLQQIEQSMNPIERWWYEMLSSGSNTANGGWKDEIEVKELFNSYKSFSDDIGAKGYRLSPMHFGRRLREMNPGMRTERATTVLDGRPYLYYLGDLESCRKDFESLIKIQIDWDVET